MTQRFAVMYGWVTLAILVVLLILVLTDSVDRSLRLPILGLAAVLIVSRVVMRMLVRKRDEPPEEPG